MSATPFGSARTTRVRRGPRSPPRPEPAHLFAQPNRHHLRSPPKGGRNRGDRRGAKRGSSMRRVSFIVAGVVAVLAGTGAATYAIAAPSKKPASHKPKTRKYSVVL